MASYGSKLGSFMWAVAFQCINVNKPLHNSNIMIASNKCSGWGNAMSNNVSGIKWASSTFSLQQKSSRSTNTTASLQAATFGNIQLQQGREQGSQQRLQAWQNSANRNVINVNHNLLVHSHHVQAENSWEVGGESGSCGTHGWQQKFGSEGEKVVRLLGGQTLGCWEKDNLVVCCAFIFITECWV
ncbi:hypothetical protein ACLOJK_014921 [Asimina triloba]